jgi:hypothetical protein
MQTEISLMMERMTLKATTPTMMMKKKNPSLKKRARSEK